MITVATGIGPAPPEADQDVRRLSAEQEVQTTQPVVLVRQATGSGLSAGDGREQQHDRRPPGLAPPASAAAGRARAGRAPRASIVGAAGRSGQRPVGRRPHPYFGLGRTSPPMHAEPLAVLAGWAHDQGGRAHRAYGSFIAVDDISFDCQAGHGHRLPRPERRRARPPPCGSWSGSPRPRAATSRSAGMHYNDIPNPGRHVGVLLDASAQHAGRTGREVLEIGAHTMGLPTPRVDEMLDLVVARRQARPSAASATTRSACGSGSASPTPCSATRRC